MRCVSPATEMREAARAFESSPRKPRRLWVRCWTCVYGSVLVAALSACGTVMLPARLEQPVGSRDADTRVAVEVDRTAISAALRTEDFHPGSRVAVGLRIENRGTQRVTLDLGTAALSIRDVDGATETRKPLASGHGEPPRQLHDGEFVAPLVLQPGASQRVWLAFGSFSPRRLRDIPEHIVLYFPASPGRVAELVLSDPGHAPVWRAGPVGTISNWGVLGHLRPDHSGFTLVLAHPRTWLDPVWLGGGFTVVVNTDDPAEYGCCGIGARLEAGVPFMRGRQGAVSAYLGTELAVRGRDDGDDESVVHAGPELGLSLTGPPIRSQHGPFPVSYERPVFGSLELKLALSWWFGRGLPKLGAPGLVVGIGFSP
jgi:hypothetical protein